MGAAQVAISKSSEVLRQAGAKFIAFVSPAFWWLDHYAGLRRHLQSQFRCVLADEHLII
jgi:hypothetical protein